MAGVMNRPPASCDKTRMSRCARATVRMAVRVLIASVAVVATNGIAATQVHPTEPTERADCATTFEAEVVVSMYSGLPNPHFMLRGQQAKSLWELLRRPRELGWRHPIPTDVGLGGYQVAFDCPARKETRVMGEILYTSEAEGGSFYDPDREVWRFLTEHYHAQPPTHRWQKARRAR